MSRVMQNISILNSALRTLLMTVLVGAVGWGTWYGFQRFYAKDLAMLRTEEELASARVQLDEARGLIREKDEQIVSLHEDVARLDTALRLLKVDQRVGRLTVLDQADDPTSGKTLTRLAFQELDGDGKPLGSAKEFTIPGDVVYIDSWVVKFDDKYVEQADLHRSTSLVLFRRAFGEQQRPLDGVALDEVGERPEAYGRGKPLSDFEKKIWGDFWSVAGDEVKQAELGIRAAHGEAPSIKVQEGKVYRVELRASAGLSITPDGSAPTQPAEPAT